MTMEVATPSGEFPDAQSEEKLSGGLELPTPLPSKIGAESIRVETGRNPLIQTACASLRRDDTACLRSRDFSSDEPKVDPRSGPRRAWRSRRQRAARTSSVDAGGRPFSGLPSFWSWTARANVARRRTADSFDGWGGQRPSTFSRVPVRPSTCVSAGSLAGLFALA
jgi:hypothetical protein